MDSDLPAPLYMFDYQQMVLKDYCLPVLFSGRMFISPDDRFLSVTVGRIDDDQGNPKEVIVIDTITGHYAVINGYTSNGWIIMNSGSTP